MFEVLVAHLRAGGMSVTVAPGDTILRHQYAKLVVNLHNGVNAVSGIPLLEMYQSRGYRRVLAACHEEALGLLSRAGIQPIPQSKLLVSRDPPRFDPQASRHPVDSPQLRYSFVILSCRDSYLRIRNGSPRC